MDIKILDNEQFKSKEIYFSEKPGADVISNLKALKFRWHSVKKCWYGFASDEEINKAIDGNGLIIPPTEEIIDCGLYDGWRGGNNRKWHSDKELKSFLLEDFRKVGIKATIRFRKAGYLTAPTITMTINESDILSYDEWLSASDNDYHFNWSGWNYYYDEEHKLIDFFGEKLCDLTGTEHDEMLEKCRYTDYLLHIKKIKNQDDIYSSSCDQYLKESAKAKFKLLREIVASYNHDQSNSMIDYFDRDIYENFALKVA